MIINTIMDNRKELTSEISEFTGEEIKYLGPPTFAYKVGEFTVNRDSSISCENDEHGKRLKNHLTEKGYAEKEVEKLEISVPIMDMDGLGLRNLMFMLHSKQYLLNKAVGCETFSISDSLIDELVKTPPTDKEAFNRIFEANGGAEQNQGIAFNDDAVTFTFPYSDNPDKNRAYMEMSALMVARAKEAKRVDPKELKPENAKYYFRIWLIRIGLDGKAGKASRKALLENLKGHTAFRTPADEEKHKARLQAKKNNTNQADN